jgi:hypothetical protein
MSNYPPGMSGRDFVRAGIDQPHYHEHEFFSDNTDPIFEDGAAVFSESCDYVEGEYGQGYRCEESRWIECGLDRVVKIRNGAPNIDYLASEESPSMDRHIERVLEKAIVTVETGDDYSMFIEKSDPPNDRGDGYVRVKIKDYILIYEQ